MSRKDSKGSKGSKDSEKKLVSPEKTREALGASTTETAASDGEEASEGHLGFQTSQPTPAAKGSHKHAPKGGGEPKQKSKTQKRKKVVDISSSSEDDASLAETEDLFEDPEEAPPKKKSKKGSKSRSSPRKGFNTKVAGALILFLL